MRTGFRRVITHCVRQTIPPGFISTWSVSVAPQLTVVTNASARSGVQCPCRTSTPLRWYPARQRHMKRQQFVQRPAMVRDSCRHGRRRLPCLRQTRMRHAKVRNRPHKHIPSCSLRVWRASARHRRALTPVLGTPVHPCGTFTLDRRARLPLAHAASLSKLRGHHDLRYPGA